MMEEDLKATEYNIKLLYWFFFNFGKVNANTETKAHRYSLLLEISSSFDFPKDMTEQKEGIDNRAQRATGAHRTATAF